jgi:hypothetical protein
MHPVSATERHGKAVRDRGVCVVPGRDGMAVLEYTDSAEIIVAAHNRITGTAKGLKACDGETRNLAQLRADVAGDLLIDGVTDDGEETDPVPASDAASSTTDPASPTTPRKRRGIGRGIRATAVVTVPALTLLGHSDEPGHLEGYGPIDPDTARRLVGSATSMTRVLTDPDTGTVLSVGRKRYKVPKPLRLWLRIRDEHCRFPGCGRTAASCDIDHTEEWHDGGPTAHSNLAHLCRSHHALKTHASWRVKYTGNGYLEWESPAGKKYSTAPEVDMDGHPVRRYSREPMRGPTIAELTDRYTAHPPDYGDDPPPF